MILAPTLSLNTPARGYDADATAFAAASGATDVAALSAFVKGVKELGLWESMVCWPLRSSQNAGYGDTVYSLGGLGTYNGALVNGPTWGADGVTFSAASSQTKTDALGLPSYPMSSVIIGQRVSGTGTTQWQYTSGGTNRAKAKRMYANNSAGIAISGVGYIVLVDSNAQTLSDNFEAFTAIIPSATNAEAEVLINTTKPAQTAQAAAWGAGASTSGVFSLTGDGVFRMSFQATFTSGIDGSALYNLCRATLGTGLGLP